jgi:DNA polymerase-3 subunit epsilon/CBS domain-containing protein
MLQTSATPLIALDAVAIDCDASDVEPRRARLCRIGAARIHAGRLADDSLDESLPAAADDGALPDMAGVAGRLDGFLGTAVVIGHEVGFDLALLGREYERAGLARQPPRVLDVRALAEVARPDLAGFSLDVLADWLELGAPQTATPQPATWTAPERAQLIARIFIALVPHLREGGIRTLAEAEQACRGLLGARESGRRTVAEDDAAASRVDAERTFAQLDSYPYRHRVAEVMSSPPLFTAADTPVAAALKEIIERRISSLFVAPPGAAPEDGPFDAETVGIVTERDLARALAEHGTAVLAISVSAIMSAPLAAVPAEAFVYRAIGRMDRLRVRHLGVVDEIGQVVGALSARDLLRMRARDAVSLGDEIDEAPDVPALAKAWAKIASVAASLLAEGVGARDIAAVISRELGALTRRAAVLAEQTMKARGRGKPPCRYAVLVLGSAGRGESLLAMDQDNAILFAHGAPDGPEDRWFAELGSELADILHAAGVPLCKGGVMAKMPAWRGSLETWRERVRHWITRSRPEDLLSVDIFFDLRCVHGDARMARDLWTEAFDAARGQVGFAKLLAEAGGHAQPALGLFGGFKTEGGRIDLKKTGLFAIVTAARCLAIRHHVVERSTPARLAGVRALRIGGERDLDQLAEAQSVLLEAILHQQIEDVHSGRRLGNAVDPNRLDAAMRERLKEALRVVGTIDDLVRTLMFAAAR